MKNLVTIKNNQFKFKGTPDTQEDNHHGIAQRWDLFENNYSVKTEVPAGKLVKYTDGSFAMFNNGNYYLLKSSEVTFISK